MTLQQGAQLVHTRSENRRSDVWLVDSVSTLPTGDDARMSAPIKTHRINAAWRERTSEIGGAS